MYEIYMYNSKTETLVVWNLTAAKLKHFQASLKLALVAHTEIIITNYKK